MPKVEIFLTVPTELEAVYGRECAQSWTFEADNAEACEGIMTELAACLEDLLNQPPGRALS